MSKDVMFPRTPEGDIDRDQVCRLLVDLLPAYATGAASEDEARFVAAALPLCSDAADELAQYYTLLNLLPAAIPVPEGEPLPVATLLERVATLDESSNLSDTEGLARQTPTVLPQWAADTPSDEARPVPTTHHPPQPRPLSVRRGVRTERDSSRRRVEVSERTPSRPWGAYALVALALLAFGASNLYWAWEYSRVRTSTEGLVSAQQQLIRQLELTLTPAPTQPTAPQVLTSQHRSLTPTTTLDGMQGIFIWSEEERIGTLYVAGMPPLESGRAYQLWLMREEGTVAASLGVFRVDAEGAATLVFESAEPIASFSDIGISIEPLGGSPQPTTPNVAVASI
jgi:hypothetical protein